ncbi:MAG: hypothetical protein JXA51_05910 [Dehalococcoidales bacterium]|nr:hypothetical protein [Dehalococcoidales bacterium]
MKVIKVKLSELSDDPRKYKLIQTSVMSRIFGKEEYTLFESYQTNLLYIIQELANILHANGIKCEITSFTEPERGQNIYNLWVRTRHPTAVEYIP